ncbi:MAG: hypothetical protein IPG91_09775 [Ideonella sp.]|nr:hypothetical protein [Ideonella sp.]
MAGLDFSTLRRSRFGVVVDALDRKLLEQFFVTLDATLKQLVPREGAPAGQQAIVAEAARLLSGAPSWRTAYHVEQLMVPLFAGPALEVELRRRLLELRRFDPAIAAGYEALLGEAGAGEALRSACLGRIVNDLQWRYEQRNLKRLYGRSVAIKTSLIFLAAFVVFFLPRNLLDAQTIAAYARHMVLYTAISAGFVGASFSMLIGLRQRLAASTLDELRNTQRLAFLLARAFIGAGAALILYYLLESQLLEGKILPDVERVVAYVRGGDAGEGGVANAALLILWCFVSGFSEQFVPNLLTRTEAQLDAQGRGGEAPPKPPG